MIFDTFLFYNELELLDLRLRVLDAVVDRFVLVESTVTFTGQPKPLVFQKNKERFAKYADKIIHIIVADSPVPASPIDSWNVEFFQRNAIMRGLTTAKPLDRIMVGDVDEIPHPAAVAQHEHSRLLVGFPMYLYYYYINCRQNCRWQGTVMATMLDLPTPQYLRNHRDRCSLYADQVGWHFSFLGGAERIREKLLAYSPDQNNQDADVVDIEHIRGCLASGEDLFFRRKFVFQKEFIPIDATYPDCIHAWLADYPAMVKR